MRTSYIRRNDFEFVALSGEATPATSAVDEMTTLVAQAADAMAPYGLTLDNVIRTRMWARDAEARNGGSEGRYEAFRDTSRPASSGYVAPDRFLTDARIALDVVALVPDGEGWIRTVVERDPPARPIRYLTVGPLVVVSGVTKVAAGLRAQLEKIVDEISGALADAGSAWSRAAEVRCYLHESETFSTLFDQLPEVIPDRLEHVRVEHVGGFSADGKLVEIEVTAIR